jgi:hypothetical protein
MRAAQFRDGDSGLWQHCTVLRETAKRYRIQPLPGYQLRKGNLLVAYPGELLVAKESIRFASGARECKSCYGTMSESESGEVCNDCSQDSSEKDRW